MVESTQGSRRGALERLTYGTWDLLEAEPVLLGVDATRALTAPGRA